MSQNRHHTTSREARSYVTIFERAVADTSAAAELPIREPCNRGSRADYRSEWQKLDRPDDGVSWTDGNPTALPCQHRTRALRIRGGLDSELDDAGFKELQHACDAAVSCSMRLGLDMSAGIASDADAVYKSILAQMP